MTRILGFRRQAARSRSRGALLVAVLVFVATADLSAQAPGGPSAQRWRVDPRASLAWWQINPHYNHLWATTCPDDPSWQPGEGRSPGYYVNYLTRKPTVDAGYLDSRIPLYPRLRVRSVCRPAVQGVIEVGDPGRWTRVRGSITVLADSLVTGLDLRDSFARRKVFETHRYPAVRFVLDTLREVQPGDTIRAIAAGTLELHGVARPVLASVKAWDEAGALRVQAHLWIPAKELTAVYNMSEWALGLGVTLGRWQEVHMGADLILRPEPGAGGAGSAGPRPQFSSARSG